MGPRVLAVVLGVLTAGFGTLAIGCGSGGKSGKSGFTSTAIHTDAGGAGGQGSGSGAGGGGSGSLGGDSDAGADASYGFGGGGESDAAPSADSGPPCSNPDDLTGCACTLGQTQKCYVGNPAQAGVGVCTWGTQSCVQNGEFAQWGSCTGYGAPTPAACDGVDHQCTGAPDPTCTCMTGTTQPCYDGPPGTEGVGTCTGGTQTCVAGPTGGSAWGTCTGEVTPTAEVCTDMLDHSCDGKSGCGDSTCSMTTGCIAQQTTYCNEGGMVYVNDVSYTGTCSYGNASLCSGDAAGDGISCGSTLGQGGTFNTHCAGTYKVCARVVSNAGCQIATGCVTVTVPTDNATVPLPPFPGFAPTSNACVDASCPYGSMSTSLDVTGTTTTGIAVSKPNTATNIDTEYWGGGGGGSGGGGGGF